MKRTVILVVFALLACGITASAATANGTLAVSATVTGSIALTFQKDANGPSITGAGTGAATLNFGSVSAWGSQPTGVTSTPNIGAGNFMVSAPIDIVITNANLTSASAKLQASLQSADATNTWAVNGVTVTNGSQATINGTFTYSTGTTGTSEPIQITIPFTNTTGSVSNTINFTATSN